MDFYGFLGFWIWDGLTVWYNLNMFEHKLSWRPHFQISQAAVPPPPPEVWKKWVLLVGWGWFRVGDVKNDQKPVVNLIWGYQNQYEIATYANRHQPGLRHRMELRWIMDVVFCAANAPQQLVQPTTGRWWVQQVLLSWRVRSNFLTCYHGNATWRRFPPFTDLGKRKQDEKRNVEFHCLVWGQQLNWLLLAEKLILGSPTAAAISFLCLTVSFTTNCWGCSYFSAFFFHWFVRYPPKNVPILIHLIPLGEARKSPWPEERVSDRSVNGGGNLC